MFIKNQRFHRITYDRNSFRINGMHLQLLIMTCVVTTSNMSNIHSWFHLFNWTTCKMCWIMSDTCKEIRKKSLGVITLSMHSCETWNTCTYKLRITHISYAKIASFHCESKKKMLTYTWDKQLLVTTLILHINHCPFWLSSICNLFRLEKRSNWLMLWLFNQLIQWIITIKFNI